jgi:hypothetical protein
MTEPTTQDPAPQEPASATGPDLGEAGKQAIDRMKADRDAAQKELKALQAQVKALQERDPVKAIAEALGVKPEPGPTGDQALAEQVKQMQQQMREAELRAARLEVAAAKGLTPAQAARLQGSTREELDADADQLKELFPTNPTSGTPGTPAPDPSQGARGGAQALEAALKDAQDKGNAREAIRLKQLLAEQRKPK